MLPKTLLARMFRTASILRWNDYLVPIPLTELDKQAHKLMISYVLGCIDEDGLCNTSEQWELVIEANVSEFLLNTILMDMKRNVLRFLKDRAGDELHGFSCVDLKPLLNGFPAFSRTMVKSYGNEISLVRAASWLATEWEFDNIVFPFNSTFYHTDDAQSGDPNCTTWSPIFRRDNYGLEREMGQLHSLAGDYVKMGAVQKLLMDSNLMSFVELFGQLRFQYRWSQSPRVPPTSVLGHSYLVAVLAYFLSKRIEASPQRVFNNVFAGLFHDLPETVTRDIVAPMKQSIPDFKALIAEFEQREIRENVLKLLPPRMSEDIEFWTSNVFLNRYRGSREIDESLSNQDIDEEQRAKGEDLDAADGRLVRACDDLAALMEADASMRHGITSEDIEAGKRLLLERYSYAVLSRDLREEGSGSPPAVWQVKLIKYLLEKGFLVMFDYYR